MRQQRFEKACDRMPPKIGGYIPDSEPVRTCAARRPRHGRQERTRRVRAEIALGLQYRRRIGLDVVRRHGDAGKRVLAQRGGMRCSPVALDALRHFTRLDVNGAEIHIDLGKIRSALQRQAAQFHCLAEIETLAGDHCECDQCFVALRCERDCALDAALRIVQIVEIGERNAKIQVCFGQFRRARDRALEARDRLFAPSASAQHRAEIDQRLRRVRIDSERLSKTRNCFIVAAQIVERATERKTGVDVPRLQFRRPQEARSRRLEIVQRGEPVSKPHEVHRRIQSGLERAAIALERFIAPATAPCDVAQFELRFAKTGIEFEYPQISTLRLLHASFDKPRIRQIVVCGYERRRQGDRTLVVLDGFRNAPLYTHGYAEADMQIGIGRRKPDGAPIKTGGFLEPGERLGRASGDRVKPVVGRFDPRTLASKVECGFVFA
jgi:hypothetical protein